MTDVNVETSPQTYARIGGVLYLIIIVVGLFGEAFVRDRLIVSGDATATAANIRSMESLWRFHIAAELFLLICDRPRSRDYAVSRWGVVSAGECWIPQSICAGAALRHGEPVAQIA